MGTSSIFVSAALFPRRAPPSLPPPLLFFQLLFFAPKHYGRRALKPRSATSMRASKDDWKDWNRTRAHVCHSITDGRTDVTVSPSLSFTGDTRFATERREGGREAPSFARSKRALSSLPPSKARSEIGRAKCGGGGGRGVSGGMRSSIAFASQPLLSAKEQGGKLRFET